ncbi:CAAX prenyl protease 2-like [Ruditapes philippinarum]|uniref:CAAX prenyl protease 2-like n=1 Tax=Ruditapes philippinarum TaxID=129788 RepID=UPI00295B53AF|nr:CAAX prenyl protease 2-like [Ruditapes philippinarum]
MAGVVYDIDAWQSILLCFLFAILYVGSLYVWSETNSKSRDHPETIRKRFISVTVVSFLVIPIVWYFGSPTTTDRGHTVLEWLGIRFSGFITALVIPLLLTMVLFAGPLTLHYMDGVFRLYLEPRYWINSLNNSIWLRNHIVAPISEEFIFRACMLPFLVPQFGEGWSVFICPLFFGVAHLHHMIEKITQNKEDVKDAFKSSAFQMAFTTVFGAYSAFLFLRTGHFVAPFLAHAFCNHMGFPAFNEVLAYQDKALRRKLIAAFVLGLLAWIYLLYPLTSPFIYSNEIYDL